MGKFKIKRGEKYNMKKYILPLILILALIFNANCFATPWELDTAVYEEKYKDVNSEDTSPYGLFFKPDGTKMYITGTTGDKVYQYSLSTSWDISTAGYEGKYKDVSDEDAAPTGLFFKPDGTTMYIVGYASDAVHQYSLSTPWDISTAGYEEKSKSVFSEDSSPRELFFKPDGTKMYVVGNYTNIVYQYSLAIEWDVSTASYNNIYKNTYDEDVYPTGLFFKPDGTKMYITGTEFDTVFQYLLSTPWDISSASYSDKYKDISSEDSYPTSVFFKFDGTTMYIMGNYTDTVYQYSLPVPPAAVNTLFFGTPL